MYRARQDPHFEGVAHGCITQQLREIDVEELAEPTTRCRITHRLPSRCVFDCGNKLSRQRREPTAVRIGAEQLPQRFTPVRKKPHHVGKSVKVTKWLAIEMKMDGGLP